MKNKFYKSDLAIFLGALIFIIGSLTLAGVILFGWDIFKKFLSIQKYQIKKKLRI